MNLPGNHSPIIQRATKRTILAFLSVFFSSGFLFAAQHIPIDCNFALSGSNVQVLWNTYPGKKYVVQTTTNLTGVWSNLPPVTATTNSHFATFPVTAAPQFFKVVKLDTEGPEIYETAPLNGGIAANLRNTLEARLRDETGINTNSITFAVGTNPPITLNDQRLNFSNSIVTYTPGTNDYLGTNGEFVSVKISVSDALGNQTTNFAWSFQLELATVRDTNTFFIGAGPQGSCGLTLLSMNGDYFTFSYTGSSCLSAGMHLVDTNFLTGFIKTVVSVTDYPASNTIVALTRPAAVAELLESGSLNSADFDILADDSGANARPSVHGKSKKRTKNRLTSLPVNQAINLDGILYQDANVTVEMLPGSQLSLDANLDITANVKQFRLTEFETKFSGNSEMTLKLRTHVGGAIDRSYVKGLIVPPISQFYGTLIGGFPVWVESVFELNVGCDLHLDAAADCTNSVHATKDFLTARRWTTTDGWTVVSGSSPAQLTFTGPDWQIAASGKIHAYVQPKVTLYLYSAAGVWADLERYINIEGHAQLNPIQWDVTYSEGLDSTIGLDLRSWDSSWGELPNHTFTIIPETILWHATSAEVAPQITSQPQDQSAALGSAATFSATVEGSEPLSIRWKRNGLFLTDDSRISGSHSSTLRINNCQKDDEGAYSFSVENSAGALASANANLYTFSQSHPGMVLIPAGSFTMGDNLDNQVAALPSHTTYVSAFLMDKVELTKAMWDNVYLWATNHGYDFENSEQGKAPTHPIQFVSWFDAVKWCNARSEKEGLVPAYYTDASREIVYRTGQVGINSSSVNWIGGYRLPTEAEWEKAARGGLNGRRFPWGDTITHDYANYFSSSNYLYDTSATRGHHPTFNDGVIPFTGPAGYFAPNAYGLYDMVGNVFEWCWDWYGPYSSGVQTDPRGSTSGSYRIFRGVGWDGTADISRTASRSYGDPHGKQNYLGFRAVLAAVARPQDAGLNDGLIAYYPLKGNVNDASNNGHNGVNVGGQTCQDRFGNPESALSFNGSSYVVIQDFSTIDLSAGFTFSAWVCPSSFTSSASRGVVSKPRSVDGTGYRLGFFSDHAELGLMASWFYPLNALEPQVEQPNNWIQIVGTMNSSNAKLYVNGELSAVMSQNGWPYYQGAQPLYIGSEGIVGAGDRAFQGAVNNVRIYNRALSEAEVELLFNLPE